MKKIAPERKCLLGAKNISSSFIQTILLVLELHQIVRFCARGLYRQSGISPCPEDISIQLFLSRISLILESRNSLGRFRKYFGRVSAAKGGGRKIIGRKVPCWRTVENRRHLARGVRKYASALSAAAIFPKRKRVRQQGTLCITYSSPQLS